MRPPANTLIAARGLAYARFPPGRFWLWEYRDEAGEFVCMERYTVRELAPPATVVLEMASIKGCPVRNLSQWLVFG